MLFFDRLSSSKIGLLGMSPPSMRWKVRAGSPDGGSILMTSAPQSARMPPAAGPATHTPISTTRTPSIGPLIDNLLSPPARASFYLTSWPLHSIVFALNDRPSVVILFVCTGNTCRSPMAAALLRHHLGVDATIEVASVGTIGWNGYPATPHAVAVLAERGIDLSAHISRKINRDTGGRSPRTTPTPRIERFCSRSSSVWRADSGATVSRCGNGPNRSDRVAVPTGRSATPAMRSPTRSASRSRSTGPPRRCSTVGSASWPPS